MSEKLETTAEPNQKIETTAEPKQTESSILNEEIKETILEMENSEPIKTNIPPKPFKRNEFGLLEGVAYAFNEDSTVDWRKMIPTEFLYVNPQKRAKLEKKYNKKFEEINIVEDKVHDDDLVINLAGIKYLLRLRGYCSVYSQIVESNESYSSVSCSIDFISNFETEGRGVSYTDSACAHFRNTQSFGQNYLVEIASNRAFCRCVRNSLNLKIVSGEEISGMKIEENGNGNESSENNKPYEILEALMQEKGIDLDRAIKRCISDGVEGAEEFKTIKDIPKPVVFGLIDKLKKKK